MNISKVYHIYSKNHSLDLLDSSTILDTFIRDKLSCANFMYFGGILIWLFSFIHGFQAMNNAFVSTQIGEKLESTSHLKDFLVSHVV